MKPIKVTMAGWRHYRDAQTVTFQDGGCAIVGPNGAGKSSVLQAIDVALFGPERRSLAEYVTEGHDKMLVELEFDHAGDRYRVRRESLRGKHLLDIERLEGEQVDVLYDLPGPTMHGGVEWESLTAETVKDSQAKLETLLGFTRDTLRASSLLMQGEAASWINRDPRDRKRVLADVLGLDHYARLHDAVRVDRSALVTENAALEGRATVLAEQAAPLEELRAQVERLAGEGAQLVETLTVTGAEIEQLAGVVAEAEQTDRDRRELEQHIQTLEAQAAALRAVDVQAQVARERADKTRTDIATLERLTVEHSGLTGTIAALEEQKRARAQALLEQARLQDKESRCATECDRFQHEIDRLHAISTAAAEKADEIAAGDQGTCETCGQALHDPVAREQAATAARAEGTKAAAQTAELHAELAKIGGLLQQAHQAAAQVTVPDEPEGLADARARLAEISDAPTRLAGSLATLAGHEDTIRAADDPQHVKQAVDAEERITEARDTLAGIEPTVGLDDTRSRHAELTDRARALQAESDRLAGQRVETKTLLDLASAATARLEEITGTLTTSRAKAAQLAMLDKAYGPSGIPLLILESVAVPAIEEHANEIVSRLGLPDFRIEIRTQAEKKDGGLRDALDVIVTTGVGERPYESFSGGEQTRLAIALRVALARLLATRRGADCRMLVVDEPDYLDTDGRARLVDVLRELEQTGVFDQVVLVSHESDLRDAFDQVIEVERGSDGWSRIVGGRVAVLA